MDSLSIGIIVTVLSFGTVLLYLFNVDFAKNKRAGKVLQQGDQQPSNMTITNNNKTGTKSGKNNGNKNGQNLQQQNGSRQHQNGLGNPKRSPFVPVATTYGQPTVKTEEKPKAANPKHQDIPDLIVGHETKVLLQAKQQQMSSSNGNKQAKKKDSKPARAVEVSEFEPSLDELDGSIAIEVFNQNGTKHNRNHKTTKRQSATMLGEDSFEGLLNRDMGSTTPSYSSEQLFTMIAASNLSKDEVGLAVEMLLNKIDSGDSNWKRPKSDPVERLKNQLRDNENVLSIEIQNHEQTRARLVELKSQVQSERLAASKAEEELSKVRRELSIVNLALEQSRADVPKVQSIIKQRDEENSKMISRLEQEKMQLQAILAEDSARGGDFEALRVKYDEKLMQLQRYELNQQKMNERIAELENKLRVADHLVDELRASKQHDDYEASAKISELKSDRIQLDKALKDQLTRFKEVTEANHLLGKTMNELRMINARQDEMLKQMTDERQVHEASMKRTLQEMELELKELQQKLNANTILSQQDERLRAQAGAKANDSSQVSDERERKLISEMNQLREGLASLFPDAAKSSSSNVSVESNSWVQEYVIALKQLSNTLDELREPNNNNMNKSETLSPKKSMIDKTTLTPRKKTPSPTSNGRSSRASTYHGHNDDKKLHETKLLETQDDHHKQAEAISKMDAEGTAIENVE